MPAVLQEGTKSFYRVFLSRVADSLHKGLWNAEPIRLYRREARKTRQRGRYVGCVERRKRIVATAIKLALHDVHWNVAKIDASFDRVSSVGVGEVVLQLVLVLNAVDD